MLIIIYSVFTVVPFMEEIHVVALVCYQFNQQYNCLFKYNFIEKTYHKHQGFEKQLKS